MRSPFIAAAVATLLVAPAFAQTTTAPAPAPAPYAPVARPGNNIGTRESLPRGTVTSNIGPSDTHSTIAPTLPAPDLGPNATPHDFLVYAQQALAAGQTGRTQEALERAMTRALTRSVPMGTANDPSQQPLVKQINNALSALGNGDRSGTMAAIQQALNNPNANQS